MHPLTYAWSRAARVGAVGLALTFCLPWAMAAFNALCRVL